VCRPGGPIMGDWTGLSEGHPREHILVASGPAAYASAIMLIWIPWFMVRRILRTRPHWGISKILGLATL
jgi:hypothetical protein